MSGQSHIPTKTEKALGYLLAGIKESINGFDSGAGLIKIPIWIAGLSVTFVFAPYVIAGGCIFALLYFLRAIYDEKQKLQREQKKIAEKNKLLRQSLIIEEELSLLLKKELLYQQDVQVQQFSNRLAGKKEQDIKIIIDNLIKNKFDIKYAVLSQTASRDSNKELLKCLLRDYFDALALYNFDPNYYKLPSGKKILSLIHEVTGFYPKHHDFNPKMQIYLKDDPNLPQNFKFYVQSENFLLLESSRITRFFTDQFHRLARFVKQQRKLRQLGKIFVDFLNDFGLGAGLATASMAMFGVLVVGAPVTWPLLVFILGSGVAFSLISLAYQKISSDRIRRNSRYLNEEIKQQKIRLQLTKRLMKIKQNPSKFMEPKLKTISFLNEGDKEEIIPYDKKNYTIPKATISKGFYCRLTLGVAARVISAISLAMIISLGTVWLGTVFFPLLPLLIPTLALGGTLSVYYIYRGAKEEIQSVKKELKRMAKVEETKFFLLRKYNDQQDRIHHDLAKESHILLQELLIEYLSYIKKSGGVYAKQANGKYPKQERIFYLIEKVSGIKRPGDEDGNLLLMGDDKFYNQLAKYLKGNAGSAEQANTLAQEFKDLFSMAPPMLTQAKVNADALENSQKKSFLKKTGNLLKDHIFTVLGVVAVGLMVPLFLLGPHMIIVTGIAAVVLIGYVLSTFAAYQAKKNMHALKGQVAKCELIEQKLKFNTKHKQIKSETQKAVVIRKEHQAVRSFEKSMQSTLARTEAVKLGIQRSFTLRLQSENLVCDQKSRPITSKREPYQIDSYDKVAAFQQEALPFISVKA